MFKGGSLCHAHCSDCNRWVSDANLKTLCSCLNESSVAVVPLKCSDILKSQIYIVFCPTGAVHLHDCPREPHIPIYLIVAGVFGLVLALLSCLPCARQAKDEPTNPLSRICAGWNSLISLFLFCWFIAGEFRLMNAHTAGKLYQWWCKARLRLQEIQGDLTPIRPSWQ